MALTRATFETWIPEEFDSAVIREIEKNSVIEARAKRHPMSTDTRHVPRSHGVDVHTVGKGATYTQDTTAVDEVLLVARKFGTSISIADEDLKDSHVAIVQTKMAEWATAYARRLDNACLGVTAAENGGTVPFTSLYRALRTSNSDTGYTADSNYTVSGTGGVTYDHINTVLGQYEQGDFFDPSKTLVVADSKFRQNFRGIKNDDGTPIFVQGQGGDSGTPDTLFGFPVVWSFGARTSATASSRPTGNPLLIVGNSDLLLLGVRSGPESASAHPDSGIGFLSDEAVLKMRARRGFAVGFEQAFALLEDNS